MPETSGRRTLGVRFTNWYLARFHRAAHRDPALSVAFQRVSNLLAAPSSLLTPVMMWRVARSAWGAETRNPAGAMRGLRVPGSILP